MLIRSQNRRALVSFENAVLDIDRSYDVNGWIAIFAHYSQSCFEIGAYSTKEKALKVLDMIQGAYENYEYEKAFKTGLRLFEAFQMPEDSEVET